MDIVTIYETNFTIFIGIFVTLVVMGTATLYDRYKSKGGASPGPGKFKFFSDLSPKTKTFSFEGLKHFSEYGKKLSSFIPKSFGSIRKNSGSDRKNSGSAKKASVKNASGESFTQKIKMIFPNAKNVIQKFFSGLSNKISSLSSSLLRRNKKDEREFVSLSDFKETNQKLSADEKVNHLDKVVESKKEELDFDDDLLTKMSNTGILKSNSPVSNGLEADTTEQFFGEMSSEFDSSFDNDFNFDESEFAIKVDGLDDDEPAEDNFAFNDNATEIKFDEDSDDLLASLKKEIIITTEKKINFMDGMQGEDLDLKAMKSDLEGVLKDLKKYRQYATHN